ncbi:hypothetical protein ACFOEE_08595 [Pseudoalteromonas fenneropenaei]|uniref:Uncharacterized protein n=1 Tax=Pseudoalteromonas fenneropenaei TaxID=1737459 RepID=A0ABV7CIW0_9GAMM
MENRTIKHAEWLKIVESRSDKITHKQGKSVARTRPFYKQFLLAFTCLIIIVGGYRAFAPTSPNMQLAALNKDAQHRIERYFSKQFMMGSWQLNRVKFGDEEIGVYIQIPTELALSEEEQRRYIQQSLCPQGDNFIWQSIGEYGLYIHLYTNNLRNSHYAQCVKA